jgi:glycosyltransferase involved in cell wall biosynthesis
VIIPARGAAATIGRTLAGLARQDLDEELEVIVALDGPADGTEGAVAAADQGARIVPVPPGAEQGPGGARNRGAAVARGSVLAFTDADCEPEPSWLSSGLGCLEGADLVQGAVRPVSGAAAGPFDRTVIVAGESGWYEAANLLVRRELFEQLGGFEDWLPMPAQSRIGGRPRMGEDVWFGWRARRSGARVRFCPDCVVRHAVFARSPIEYVAEHARRVHFPALAAKIPELRRTTFFGRLFLDRRTAAFDAALLGVAVALARRKRWPLAGAMPYLAIASQRFSARHPGTAKVLLADLAADALSLASLAVGSRRARTLLL